MSPPKVRQSCAVRVQAEDQLAGQILPAQLDFDVRDALFKEREDVVVLTRVESDRLTSYLTGFTGNVIDEINGEKVKNQSYDGFSALFDSKLGG